MKSALPGISENVLFSLLIAAVIGWTAASLATETSAPASAGSPSAQCKVAPASAGISNS